MIREIAGHQNHSVKLARKLQRKKFRRERGLLVGEGMDLLTAAVAGGADVREILVRRELLSEVPAGLREQAAAFSGPGGPLRGDASQQECDGYARETDAGSANSSAIGATEDTVSRRPVRSGGRGFAPQRPSSRTPLDEDSVSSGVDIGVCNQETLDHASSLGGSTDVIFICLQPQGRLADIDLGAELVYYLDGVGDPGNVGTLTRSAVAFGLGGVICSPGTADPWSPKALRAGMGAQFSLPVVTEVEAADLQGRFAALAAKGRPAPRVLIADSNAGVDIREIARADSPAADAAPAAGMVLVLGSERSGPVAQWAQAQRVTIPQRRFDSLNVAMAGTILAYELSRFAARRPAL
jgi:TrmH family RNA methyltransferase